MEFTSLDRTFRIGEQTLPHVRRGFNQETAQKIAEIIRDISAVDAVAVTDDKTILGYAGYGCPFMVPGRPILTNATRSAIQTGEERIVSAKPEFACPVEGCPCPLQAAVIAPLRLRERVVGTLKLYRTDGQGMPEPIRRLARGIAQLLSLQLELGEAEQLRELAARARLEALQAQIRPHFLFNTLNAILLFSRIDADRARDLLVKLAGFLRRSLAVRGEFIALREELDYVRAYLEIEQARFGDAVRFDLEADPDALDCLVPVLTIQPLVENAIVHGLAAREGGGWLAVRARVRRGSLHVVVADAGAGMPRGRVRRILEPGTGTGMGLGLPNVHQRLTGIYGEKSRLRIRSRPGRGTVVRLVVPVRRQDAAGGRGGAGR